MVKTDTDAAVIAVHHIGADTNHLRGSVVLLGKNQIDLS